MERYVQDVGEQAHEMTPAEQAAHYQGSELDEMTAGMHAQLERARAELTELEKAAARSAEAYGVAISAANERCARIDWFLSSDQTTTPSPDHPAQQVGQGVRG